MISKTRKANGKMYYLNSKATFHIPNTAEGRDFYRKLKKFLNYEFFTFFSRGRGPRKINGKYHASNDYLSPVNPVCKNIAVYLRTKPVSQSVRREQAFWLTSARHLQQSGRQPKRRPELKEIWEENNITIRMAMAVCYGIDKFINDSNAIVIDRHGEYELLRLPLEPNTSMAWRAFNIVALKMRCPSTSVVYIQTVPPETISVTQALDWIFQTENYLQNLKAEA